MIITVTNNKGGTGKTTTVWQLGLALARAGHSVLMVDADGQGNLTQQAGHDMKSKSFSLTDVLDGAAGIPESSCHIWDGDSNLYILPADDRLTDTGDDMVTRPLSLYKLGTLLATVDFADIILVDTPPTLSSLTLAAMMAADYLIIPTLPVPFSIAGVERILEKTDEIEQALGKAPHILGYLVTQLRHTQEHTLGLGCLNGMPMNQLGVIPQRGGVGAAFQLEKYYSKLATAIMDQAGGAS